MANKADSVEDSGLSRSLVQLHQEIQRIYTQTSRQLGLTPQQAQLLCEAQTKTPTLSEIAVELACDKANVTGLVDRLTSRGLIERVSDDHDGRVIRVCPTEEGTQFVAQLQEILESRLSGIAAPHRTNDVVTAINESLTLMRQA